jgi:fructan beta-fructosidase
MVTVLADLHRVRFYGSPDLRHWTHLNDFGPAGSADGVWECPDLFPLAVEGAEGEARWVLKVDVGSHNLPTNEGAQYFVGRFDGVCFTNDNPPELALWADAGRDFYAVQSWSDIPAADGRRLWLAWLSNWHYANITPTAPWRGMMTIPRVVTLRRTPVGLRLAQRPVAELEALRRTHFGRAGLPVSEANRQLQAAGLAGDALEIIADFRLDTATEIGLRVRVGSAEATVIGYDVAAQHLCVDRSQSGNVGFSSGFPGRRTAALPQAEGRVRLHVFVDRCSVEVFGGAGEAVLTDLIFPSPDSQGLEVYSAAGEAGADALLERLDIWRLEQT